MSTKKVARKKEEDAKKDSGDSEVSVVAGVNPKPIVEFVETAETKEDKEKEKESSSADLIKNPWNAFQHANKRKGWSMGRMQEEYKKSKETRRNEKP